MNAPLPRLGSGSTARLLQASVACHLGAIATSVSTPSLWPWALGAVALNHALITGIGLWPRSDWLGPNLCRLPAAAAARGAIALTLDDGPDPQVTPALLDLLDAHRVRATFFCIGRHAQAHPALCRDIVRRGHSVQNHSQRHAHHFSLLGAQALTREIGAAQATLSHITGEQPRFFRAPAGLRNLFLEPVLQQLDLRLVSWTRRGFDTVRRDPTDVLARLTRGLTGGDIVLLHDGHAARTRSARPVVLEVLPRLLERVAAAGLHCVTLTQALPAQAHVDTAPTLLTPTAHPAHPADPAPARDQGRP